jgi:hypothetical protein
LRELIRVNTLVEANDLKMLLNSRGIDCEIPDQYSLSIGGVSTFALARGRILVNESDYQQALEILKKWQSPNVPKNSKGVSRTLEHPWVVGISPRQIIEGFRKWSNLSFMGRIKVLGGVIIYLGILTYAISYFVLRSH